MVVSSYQSVSGAGQPGLRELDEQWTKGVGESEWFRRAGASGTVVAGDVWDRPIAGNVIPLAGSLKDGGYTSEEWKMVRETCKILHAPEIQVTATCVRVPVYVGHGVAMNVQFERRLRARRPSRSSPTCPASSSSTAATGTRRRSRPRASTPCWSGAVREDLSQENTLDLWATGDNLRKGAALNGIQLAELLLGS